MSVMQNIFLPHSHCILYNEELIIGLTVSNAVIFLSYIWIAFKLLQFVFKAKDKEYIESNKFIIISFSLFIGFCGLTHLSDIVTMWYAYWFMDMYIRIFTAFFSVSTAILIGRFMMNQLKREDNYSALKALIKKQIGLN